MVQKDLVWYVAYGSNLYYERFLCYIFGGKPIGSNKSQIGCRNKSIPVADSPILINRELFFARESNSWGGGGVAFIKPESDINASTFARMYLISRIQFEDIVKQENDIVRLSKIDYRSTIENGSSILTSDCWYNKILYMGEIDSFPAFSITADEENLPFQKPSVQYLTTLIKGLKQTYNFNSDGIAGYLIKIKGIAENYKKEQLQQLDKELLSALADKKVVVTN